MMNVKDLIAGEKKENTDGQAHDTQDRAPILEALQAHLRDPPTSFDVPGHQSGKAAPHSVTRLLGKDAFAADTTTQKGLDDRRERKRVRQRAERLAAELWRADHCFFSTNGTSLSNHAAVLAAAGAGDTVLVSRNSHKSLIGSLILANVRPVFLEPDYDDEWGIAHGTPARELEEKLERYPETRAVFVIAPTYFGITPDVCALSAICHRRHIPLVVDEAWGPHFPFHPDMPPAAIQAGADISTGSIHKTMAGLEQASLMLLRSDLIANDRFNLCYDLFETTSPSGLILASIDATRRQFAEEGQKLIEATLELTRYAREEIARIEGIRIMGREVLDGDARQAMDETKVLLDISGLGVNGYEAEDWLMREKKLTLGLSDERRLLVIFTIGTDRKSTVELIEGLRAMANWARDDGSKKAGLRPAIPRVRDLVAPQEMTPAEAFYARSERVPLAAAGRIAAEMISPYPPGIPRVIPGQRMTPAQVEYLEISMELGTFAYDASDMELSTVRVVA
jgi:lysine decarboxylase